MPPIFRNNKLVFKNGKLALKICCCCDIGHCFDSICTLRVFEVLVTISGMTSEVNCTEGDCDELDGSYLVGDYWQDVTYPCANRQTNADGDGNNVFPASFCGNPNGWISIRWHIGTDRPVDDKVWIRIHLETSRGDNAEYFKEVSYVDYQCDTEETLDCKELLDGLVSQDTASQETDCIFPATIEISLGVVDEQETAP